MSEFGSAGIDSKIALSGGIFLGLGLVLLFVLFFWILHRSRFSQDKEEKGYGGLIRFLIFFFSLFFIFLGWLFFQMQDYLRPFKVLSSEEFVGEIKLEPGKDSSLTLILNITGKQGKIYKESFEVLKNNRFGLEAELLDFQKWLKLFGFIGGYKLTQLEIFSAESSTTALKTFELSGGPTEGWKKISGLKKFLPLVRAEKLVSGTFFLNPGETKKLYIKQKRLVVE